jgi:hypothetical protein
MVRLFSIKYIFKITTILFNTNLSHWIRVIKRREIKNIIDEKSLK